MIQHNLDRCGGRTANLADAYLNKARTHHCKRDLSLALDYYRKALDIQKRIYFKYHPDIGQTYKNIADVLFDMKNNPDEALTNYEAAKTVFEKSLCKGNKRLSDVCDQIHALRGRLEGFKQFNGEEGAIYAG